MDRLGVVAYCPTVRTASLATLRRVLRTIAEACDQSPDVASHIAGIHLDGPFISPEDGPRGTHPATEVRPADWDVFCRLQEAARGRIRMLTLSPEGDGMPDFIERVTAGGVSVAIGRTAASGDQIRAAVDAGARLSMHLGTAVHGRLRRHPNYLWDQLAEDRLDVALPADDGNLPDSFARIMLRSKSPERCLLVSDLHGSGGTPIARGIEESAPRRGGRPVRGDRDGQYPARAGSGCRRCRSLPAAARGPGSAAFAAGNRRTNRRGRDHLKRSRGFWRPAGCPHRLANPRWIRHNTRFPMLPLF